MSTRERLRRPPAVPLVTFDPHTSIWSFADRLTDDWTRHWTGTKMSIFSVVRIDGVPYRLMGGDEWGPTAAEQTACEVHATKTVYRFRCGGAEIGIEFVTPLVPDDLELISRPASYLIFSARALDGRAHSIAAYIDMSGEIAVNLPHQRVFWSEHTEDGVTALSFRCEDQNVLAVAGDHRRIDWGTGWLAGRTGRVVATVGDIDASRDTFVASGQRCTVPPKTVPRKVDYNADAVLSLIFDLSVGTIGSASETVLIGYDDEWAIEYFGQKLRAWWRRHADAGPMKMLAKAFADEKTVLARAATFDRELAARARACAGEGYADLLALSWRHTIAAHKLVAGPDGNPIFLSKENFSNGCIGTADVAYPSAPLFLVFNPALLQAMLRPYYSYCMSPAWPFPFAAHDLGTYPKANGQTYRNYHLDPGQPIIETQMPVEECGNLLILAAAHLDTSGDAEDARKHWKLLAQWADYLAEHGEDPGEQLCTDDFSGVLGHNVNLAVKAACGLACAARLGEAIGEKVAAKRYGERAKAMADSILARSRDGQGTRLAFNQPGSWSIKYNMVWDRYLGLGLWTEAERRRELAFYRGKVDLYGCPLDGRSALTKPEWMLWAASLAEDPELFADFVDRILRYANDTPSRVPISDLYLTDRGRKIGFQARSVLGGLFIGLMKAKAG